MLAYFTRACDKHARYGSAKSPISQGHDSASNVTGQFKEDLLQLMLQMLSNQKKVTETATWDKEHLWESSKS